MDSFDAIFEEALCREEKRHETPFEDALSAWDESLLRSLPGEPPASPDWTCRPEWAEALGVSLPCTEGDLKRAFRRAAFEAHPDRGGTSEAFRRATAAFEAAQRGEKSVRPLPQVTSRYATAAHTEFVRVTVERAA